MSPTALHRKARSRTESGLALLLACATYGALLHAAAAIRPTPDPPAHTAHTQSWHLYPVPTPAQRDGR